MSLRARTSALDMWLLLKRSEKVVRDLMTGYSGMDGLHQPVVCSGILARQSDCNTFLLSVCVRSSELQVGVHLSVSSSPRVILDGTVLT